MIHSSLYLAKNHLTMKEEEWRDLVMQPDLYQLEDIIKYKQYLDEELLCSNISFEYMRAIYGDSPPLNNSVLFRIKDSPYQFSTIFSSTISPCILNKLIDDNILNHRYLYYFTIDIIKQLSLTKKLQYICDINNKDMLSLLLDIEPEYIWEYSHKLSSSLLEEYIKCLS